MELLSVLYVHGRGLQQLAADELLTIDPRIWAQPTAVSV